MRATRSAEEAPQVEPARAAEDRRSRATAATPARRGRRRGPTARRRSAEAPIANRNRTVSSPSRATETNASPASACADPRRARDRPPPAARPSSPGPGGASRTASRSGRAAAMTAARPSNAFLDDHRRRPMVATGDPEGDRQADRGADPDPDPRKASRAGLDQVGADDPDDQGGLEPSRRPMRSPAGKGAEDPSGRAMIAQGRMTSSCKVACHAESTELRRNRSSARSGGSVRRRGSRTGPAARLASSSDRRARPRAPRRSTGTSGSPGTSTPSACRDAQRRLPDRQELGPLQQPGQDALPDERVGKAEQERARRERR